MQESEPGSPAPAYGPGGRALLAASKYLAIAGGLVYLTSGNVNALLNSLKNLAYARLSNYDLVVIPLFFLMGQFATHGGLSKAGSGRTTIEHCKP